MNVNYLVGIFNYLKLGSLVSNCWFLKVMRFVFLEFKSKNLNISGVYYSWIIMYFGRKLKLSVVNIKLC